MPTSSRSKVTNKSINYIMNVEAASSSKAMKSAEIPNYVTRHVKTAESDELDSDEEDSDAHGGDDGGASAAGDALSAAGRTGDRAGGREGAAKGYSGRDEGCTGARDGECWDSLSDLNSGYGSRYTAQFVYWLALAMLCLLFRLVLN